MEEGRHKIRYVVDHDVAVIEQAADLRNPVEFQQSGRIGWCSMDVVCFSAFEIDPHARHGRGHTHIDDEVVDIPDLEGVELFGAEPLGKERA